MSAAPIPEGGGRPMSAIGRVMRYGQALAGPVGVAGSQFLLAVLLLRELSPAEFGAFSFLLVAFQFASGLWSALFCAPLPAALAERDADGKAAALAAISGANLLLATLSAALFVAMAAALGLGAAGAALFGLYAGVGLARWFARALAYVEARPLLATASDVLFGATLLSGCAAMWFGLSVTAAAGAGALLLASLLGMLPFMRRGRLGGAQAILSGRLGPYREVWRVHARWSLAGVVSTEATVNAHAYVVTLVSGPAAFAALAASALLLRPLGVVMNALIEFERPQMARQMATHGVRSALRSAVVFRLVLAVAWTVNAAAAVALLAWAPGLMFPAKYPFELIAVGAALWLAVGAVRTARLPESALLQAAGRFKPLAWASVYSAFVSIGAVLVLLLLAAPVWSILGVLLGELVFAAFLWRTARRWKREALCV